MSLKIFDQYWLPDRGGAYLKDYADEGIYLEMPLVNLIYHMMEMAAEGLPITKTGNPTSNVLMELYPLGPKDDYWESFPGKRMVLSACPEWAAVWEITGRLGLFRKYKGTLRLSSLGKELKGHPKRLAHFVFFALQFVTDTSIVDAYEYRPFNHSLDTVAMMLDAFGDEFRSVAFYAEKYAEVDPVYVHYFNSPFQKYENAAISCFGARIMQRFYLWLGLVEEKESYYDSEKKVCVMSQYKISPLFRKIIGIDRPKEKIVIPLILNRSADIN